MLDTNNFVTPVALKDIADATQAINFTMGSDLLTGSLLRTLAATKPSGAILELATGTGLATAWLLDGMDAHASLITVDQDEHVTAIAKRFLGSDLRVTFVTMDGATFIKAMQKEGRTFDLIFADMPPGKFQLLDETLQLLRVGGIYIVDDLLPIPTWEPEHAPRVARLIATLEQREDLHVMKLNWSTGILIAVKKH
jgi:predicted O-methyltransferase YrrM